MWIFIIIESCLSFSEEHDAGLPDEVNLLVLLAFKGWFRDMGTFCSVAFPSIYGTCLSVVLGSSTGGSKGMKSGDSQGMLPSARTIQGQSTSLSICSMAWIYPCGNHTASKLGNYWVMNGWRDKFRVLTFKNAQHESCRLSVWGAKWGLQSRRPLSDSTEKVFQRHTEGYMWFWWRGNICNHVPIFLWEVL